MIAAEVEPVGRKAFANF